MYIYYNPNPLERKDTGDCAIRAVAKALNTDWETAYTKLSLNGFAMGDLPNSNQVIGALLRTNGYYRATTDPTVTPAPVIEVQNSNLTIERIA